MEGLAFVRHRILGSYSKGEQKRERMNREDGAELGQDGVFILLSRLSLK